MSAYSALEVRRRGDIWYVRHAQARGSKLGEIERAGAEAQINTRMGGQETRLAPFHLVWRQELPITTYREGATAFSCGEEWAEALLAGKADELTFSGLSGEVSRFVVETALERGGAIVAGDMRRRAALRLMSFSAAIAALAWLGVLTVRSLRWPRLREQNARTVVALHVEAANRTKHVRKALARRDPATTDVLFVGRLHMSRLAAQEILEREGWGDGYYLAWDWRAVLGGLRKGLEIISQAPKAIRASGYRPTFAQLIAINLRVFLGTASAWRWQARKREAEIAVFGHAARADTVLLEAAMQSRGVKTAHWMHGLSVGRAYQGRSNLCVTLCSHDQRWHSKILQYERNVAFVLPKPQFRTGNKPGWAVLTNMTHYGYTYFPSIGPAHELKLIDLIAQLTLRERVDPGSVIWKPHPVFYQTDPQVRDLVTRRLADAGFLLWPEESMPPELVAAFETLIVTPSGVALDMLKAGRLPVVAEFQPIDPDHVLAHLEPRGHDVETLGAALKVARDPTRAEALFDGIWERTGPAAIGSLEEIERAMSI